MPPPRARREFGAAAAAVDRRGPDTIGGRVPRSTAVLVEAVAEVRPRVERPPPPWSVSTRACASSVSNVYSGWRIARSTMTRAGSSAIVGVDRHEVLDSARAAPAAGSCGTSSRARRSASAVRLVDVPRRPRAGRRGMTRGSVCRTTRFDEYSNPPSAARSARPRPAAGPAHRRRGSPARRHRTCRSCRPRSGP